MWLEFDLLSCSFFNCQDIWLPKAPYFGRRCRCGRRKRANLWEWKDKWHSTNTRPVQGETFGFSNYDPSWTVEKNAKIDGSVKSKNKKYIQHLPYFVLTLSCQTYTGTIIPAVDRICVGVSPGEVCVVKPIQFTPQRKQSGHFTVHSSCFILILCSALVSWGLMEQGRPQRLRCWLETLTSPLERPQSLVTG